MSEMVSRPRVRSVSATSLASTAVSAAVLFADAWRALSAAARTVYSQTAPVRPSISHATTARPIFARPALLLPEPLSASDRVKVTTLHELATSQCVVEPQAGLRERLEQLHAAQTGPEALSARRALLDSLEQAHQDLFARALSEACALASSSAGFERAETLRCGHVLRVVATDSKGRALVSEIRPNAEGEYDLATEVVGVSDGSCHALLDRFDQSLEHLGVRSGPPQRRVTGGVCELAAARDLLRKKALGSVRRAQRLNQPTGERTKA